jgi:hypothetical protein
MPKCVERGAVVAGPVADVGGRDGVGRPEVIGQPVHPGLGLAESGGAAGATAEGDSLGAGRGADLVELAGDECERLVPGAALPAGIGVRLGAGAAERIVDPVGVIVELRRGAPLAADGAAERMGAIRFEREHARALNVDERGAGDLTEAAVGPNRRRRRRGRGCFFQGHLPPASFSRSKRAMLSTGCVAMVHGSRGFVGARSPTPTPIAMERGENDERVQSSGGLLDGG